jgi:co-chaperonin GroES (HSP10)
MAVGGGKILENGQVRPMDLKVGDRVLLVEDRPDMDDEF